MMHLLLLKDVVEMEFYVTGSVSRWNNIIGMIFLISIYTKLMYLGSFVISCKEPIKNGCRMLLREKAYFTSEKLLKMTFDCINIFRENKWITGCIICKYGWKQLGHMNGFVRLRLFISGSKYILIGKKSDHLIIDWHRV